ncbi:hypothetical protein BC940DRAFT_334676 [Gongronella butleri]|nr:hypothetical protein BC940DRAFT_334676 [Gongronella butleri]
MTATTSTMLRYPPSSIHLTREDLNELDTLIVQFQEKANAPDAPSDDKKQSTSFSLKLPEDQSPVPDSSFHSTRL